MKSNGARTNLTLNERIILLLFVGSLVESIHDFQQRPSHGLPSRVYSNTIPGFVIFPPKNITSHCFFSLFVNYYFFFSFRKNAKKASRLFFSDSAGHCRLIQDRKGPFDFLDELAAGLSAVRSSLRYKHLAAIYFKPFEPASVVAMRSGQVLLR